MKLGSLRTRQRDGTLIVADKLLSRMQAVPDIAPTLQAAIDDWSNARPRLQAVYSGLNSGAIEGTALNIENLAAPLPRAYQWLDGSAYLSHVKRVRKARGVEMPPTFLTDPLMYQGGSDVLLGPRDPLHLADESWGLDFEAEVAVITDDVPQGTAAGDAWRHIALLVLVNDISLRNLIPAELAKGFGFLHGKPPTAFAPVAVTPDSLGDAWANGKLSLPLLTHLNGEPFGRPDAGQDMQFDFATLISHAAKTRPLGAGTIIGSGTVSNEDAARGYSCLVEKRVVEMVEYGEARTPFLTYGDRVRIEMRDQDGNSIFGAIEQEVVL